VEVLFGVEHDENGWRLYDRFYTTRAEAEASISAALRSTHRVVEFKRAYCAGCGELSHTGAC
jgi:hypothetical protein